MSCIYPSLYILINVLKFNVIFLRSTKSYKYPHAWKTVIQSSFYG